jgi:hypothetical protein
MDAHQHHPAEIPSLSPDARALLDYLDHDLPGYPVNLDIDRPFVEELHNDFPDLDLLEQIKLFPWYRDNRPPLERRPRATLRRSVHGALTGPPR